MVLLSELLAVCVVQYHAVFVACLSVLQGAMAKVSYAVIILVEKGDRMRIDCLHTVFSMLHTHHIHLHTDSLTGKRTSAHKARVDDTWIC